MFTITNSNDDTLTIDDGYTTPESNWNHRKWEFTLTALDSGEFIDSEYSVGELVEFSNTEELHASIMMAIAGDVALATEVFTRDNGVRELLKILAEDFGLRDPVKTYDVAVQLECISTWYYSLTPAEQRAIQDVDTEEY